MTGKDDRAHQLQAGLRGDSRAYAAFLRGVTPLIRRMVQGGAGTLGEPSCEDIVQDVLIAIHLKRHTWDQTGPLRPWLDAIVRYKIAEARKAGGRHVDLPISALANDPAATPDPTEAADMLRMIALLDGRSAEVVRHIGIEGCSVAETGRLLTMTEGAVRVALHRAFKRLAALRERHLE